MPFTGTLHASKNVSLHFKKRCMNLQHCITETVQVAFNELYGATLSSVDIQPTRKEFEGDITVVLFSMTTLARQSPETIGKALGDWLLAKLPEIKNYHVVKGFLNITIADKYYLRFFNEIKGNSRYGCVPLQAGEKAIMVEYSSPNTNKPLHLGHIRNNLLGYSVAQILKAAGKKVYKTQIINDRGIHICKSMLAYQKYGQGEIPSENLKGDKLVGTYYVKFDEVYKQQLSELEAKGTPRQEAEKQTPILLEAQELLRKWEAGDETTVALWKRMNQWVYEGFEATYKKLGVDFDRYYYESDTYLLGKEVVAQGLQKGVFYRKDDGSVWVNLTDEGLDEKIVLRADGTSVYITQDIGTAIQRVKDHPDVGGMVYVVGNEQDYHFKVLFLILKKLGFSWSEQLHHLSYGMVDLPSGKMKSREGTVVDADDLIEEMTTTAGEIARELGKLDEYSELEKQHLYQTIGLGALKYFILKVDPKKRILFNPQASIDFNGNTGPFIQYTYARIQSILRKIAPRQEEYATPVTHIILDQKEKQLLKLFQLFPEIIQDAAREYSPALVANYLYELVKEFNSFYQSVPILGAETENQRLFRVQLSKKTGDIIRAGAALLGIEVPDRM